MKDSRRVNSIKLAIFVIAIDFIFLVASFSGIHFVKNGDLKFSLIHRELFIIICLIWAFVYLIYRKLDILSDSSSFYSYHRRHSLPESTGQIDTGITGYVDPPISFLEIS